MEIRASTPLVVFRESVAFESTSPEQTDRPPQLSLPPWSEEEGTRRWDRSFARPDYESHLLNSLKHIAGVGVSAGGVCKITTSSGDCRLTIRCLALPARLAQLIDTEPYEVSGSFRER